MFSHWAPPLERTTMIAMATSGCSIGTLLAMPLTTVMCQFAGWPSVFICFGAAGIVWTVVWMFVVFDSPELHPRISPEEKKFILESQKKDSKPIISLDNDSRNSVEESGKQEIAEKKTQSIDEDASVNVTNQSSPSTTPSLSPTNSTPIESAITTSNPSATTATNTTTTVTPWRHILTSPRVAVICAAHMANNWCFYTLLTSGPKFLRDVYKFDLSANGAISTVPYGLSLIIMVTLYLVVCVCVCLSVSLSETYSPS